ncbi:MAG: hypothetical protein P3X24_003075 [bacterium]|nr:hypothetical protein [bacterium]
MHRPIVGEVKYEHESWTHCELAGGDTKRGTGWFSIAVKRISDGRAAGRFCSEGRAADAQSDLSRRRPRLAEIY